MTYGDLIKLFKTKYPDLKYKDYRPIAHEMFTDHLKGITIWLENGDVIEYYPKPIDK